MKTGKSFQPGRWPQELFGRRRASFSLHASLKMTLSPGGGFFLSPPLPASPLPLPKLALSAPPLSLKVRDLPLEAFELAVDLTAVDDSRVGDVHWPIMSRLVAESVRPMLPLLPSDVIETARFGSRGMGVLVLGVGAGVGEEEKEFGRG